MVLEADGEPLGTPGAQSHEIEWLDVVEHDPDVIVLMPCGFGTERSIREGKEFLSRVRSTSKFDFEGVRTYAVDGSAYFSRPGPRLWDGLALLAVLQHPDRAHRFDGPRNAFGRLA
jgi:iron complex transport system substrate-binding protein